MPTPYLHLQYKNLQTLKQMQRLILSSEMQQAIHLLQLPTMELQSVIEAEMEINPVLETEELAEQDDGELDSLEAEVEEEDLDSDRKEEKELIFEEGDFEIFKELDLEYREHFTQSGDYTTASPSEEDKKRSYLDSLIIEEPTLFEVLMQQAKEVFETASELQAAEAIIGNIDPAGFLAVRLEEISTLEGIEEKTLLEVLALIQTFDPPGIGARDLKELILIQLERKEKVETLAYAIVKEHFDDLLHSRIPQIAQALRQTPANVQAAIEKEIAHLDFHPGLQHSLIPVQTIVPDLVIEQTEEGLKVEAVDEHTPRLRLSSRYLKMLEDPDLDKETKHFIHSKLISAKWLLRNLLQRNDTLVRIGEKLIIYQKNFFMTSQGEIAPLTMKLIAEELELHESTVVRAVANKYVDTPKGVFPLRSFFVNAYSTEQGLEISSTEVKDKLKKLIESEDKKSPLSDERLSELLKAQGIPCARRTVAKYRSQLLVGNVQQRRSY